MADGLSLAEAARRVGVTPATLRRWIKAGVVPEAGADGWESGAVAQARIVARMRERGHSLEAIREAYDAGKLAFGYVEDLLATPSEVFTVEQAAAETGLEPALIERIITAMGFSTAQRERLTEDDLQLLRYGAAVLAAGFPLI